VKRTVWLAGIFITLSGAVSVANSFLAEGIMQGASVPVDPIFFWIQVLKEAGTIGACVWFILWLQKRLEAMTAQVAEMNTRMSSVIQQNSENLTTVKLALERNNNVIERCSRK